MGRLEGGGGALGMTAHQLGMTMIACGPRKKITNGPSGSKTLVRCRSVVLLISFLIAWESVASNLQYICQKKKKKNGRTVRGDPF